MSDFIDISRVLSEETAVWPGDTKFSRNWVMSIDSGCSCNTSTYTLSAHTGSHTDAPSHYVKDAASIADVDLTSYMGRCRVIHIKSQDAVNLSDLEGINLKAEERLLFRTPNAPATDAWHDNFAYISKPVAEALAQANIRLVGIDTPSVDPMTSKTLDAHKALITGNVAILESIDLTNAPEGHYELLALPLRIQGGDSSPVRAILRPL